MNIFLLIVAIYSYILGSIPFGLILIKLFLNEDIRNIGSGNIGATNVLRTGKKTLAASTLCFDILKGFIAVYITSIFFPEHIYFAATLCLLGHIFPIWLKFKGGKGVATYLGIIFALSLKLGIIFGLIWIITASISRYSSLSSVLSILIVFIFSFFFENLALSIFLFNAFVIIVFTHKQNIVRLKNKSESKIKF